MKQYRAHLPPLDALVAFEAAARLSNFTAAARELNLSQSAISQQIQNLEANLGVPLFSRMGRRVHLNHLGREFQHIVARALEQIANASREIRTTRGRAQVTVAADQSIAWMWLMPRLPLFQRAQPDVTIRLVVSDSLADCLNDMVSLALVHGRGNWPGYRSRVLFGEEVFPVCSPGYLDRAGHLQSPEDLRNHTLLHLEDTEWQWLNWRMWLTEMDLEAPSEEHGLVINNYPLLIEAAKNGHRIALGWRYLVDADIQTGRLVRPVEGAVSTDCGYHLAWRSDREPDQGVLALCDWLIGSVSAPPELGQRP